MTTTDATLRNDAEPNSPSLAEVLWTYAYAYTAAHDFAVSDRIMVDDYVLRMGFHALRGRNEQYQPATQRQYRQYPTLGFTVHRLVTNGERAALHFTEHGRSMHGGGAAAWQGVSLYRWDGERLTECRVEQDYCSRRRQLDSGEPLPVASPGIDPWATEPMASDESAVATVSEWLSSGSWLHDRAVSWDDGSGRARWAGPETEVLDIFSAGTSVAFHAVVTGIYAGGVPGSDACLGADAEMFTTGIVDVSADDSTDSGKVVAGQLVTDRHSMLARLNS
ncbi:nuclear transport factor 2 family protein [Streptomyces sp. NPDC046805]|uniref:nuclear transport factor 2 family protein n=1 Tax=Streptomyces sp. NPDC046805 TaxID=3155134 RepID=UPI0033E891C9